MELRVAGAGVLCSEFNPQVYDQLAGMFGPCIFVIELLGHTVFLPGCACWLSDTLCFARLCMLAARHTVFVPGCTCWLLNVLSLCQAARAGC